jgi:hypothetical protein
LYDFFLQQKYGTTQAKEITGFSRKRLDELLNKLETDFSNIKIEKVDDEW